MALKLIARGHEVTVVCGSAQLGDTGLEAPVHRGLRKGIVDGINVIELVLPYSNHDGLLKRSLLFLKFAIRSVGIALTEKYDVLFATSTPLTACMPGIAMRFLKPRKRFIFEVRDLWPELPKAMGVIRNPLILGAMGVLEWLGYRAAHACIGLSPGICEGIRTRSPKHRKISMIPNGCDLELFQAVTRDSDGPLKAIFTGAHGQANGLDAVLDAAGELLRRKRHDIEIHFIGDGKRKPALLDRKESEGLINCFFHDPIPKTELRERFKDVDVGLMILANVPAFYYGTSPNKFFDYLASGLPVLNNYPGWLAELLESEACGLPVAPESPGAFADALEKFKDDPAERNQMGARARGLAERNFDRDKMSDEFVNFIEAMGVTQ